MEELQYPSNLMQSLNDIFWFGENQRIYEASKEWTILNKNFFVIGMNADGADNIQHILKAFLKFSLKMFYSFHCHWIETLIFSIIRFSFFSVSCFFFYSSIFNILNTNNYFP